MIIVGIADTHMAHEEVNVPPGDILVVAGDFTSGNMNIQDVITFNAWLGKLPHKHKIVVAGNHDFICENNYLHMQQLFTNAEYLDTEATTIEGIKFFGCPWTPDFNQWAFMYPRDGDKGGRIWRQVPEDTQVLVTHGPPAGTTLGKLPDHYDRGGEDCGCKMLRARILELPKLQAAFCGHIHEGAGQEYVGNTLCINATVMDGAYTVCHHGKQIEIV